MTCFVSRGILQGFPFIPVISHSRERRYKFMNIIEKCTYMGDLELFVRKKYWKIDYSKNFRKRHDKEINLNRPRN